MMLSRARTAALFLMAAACLMAAPVRDANAKLFTIDGNENDLNEIDGSDDVTFGFMSSRGWVSGTIRATRVADVDPAELEESVEYYKDFSDGDVALDFANMDVLIFDIVLDQHSAPLVWVKTSVTTDPLDLNPDGAGYLEGCNPPGMVGCAHHVPNGGKAPKWIGNREPMLGMPGSAIFAFNTRTPWWRRGLQQQETTQRLFVAWEDTGPQSPLSKEGQQAYFTLGSGQSHVTLHVGIVPEPSTAMLLGFGFAALVARRRYQIR